MTLKIPSISQEWVSTLVVAEDDPTGLPVRFAFTNYDPDTEVAVEPGDTDWKDGEWVGAVVTQPDGRFQVRARVQIGPGTDFVLPNGWRAAWCRVVEATPNGPTRHFDVLEIT